MSYPPAISESRTIKNIESVFFFLSLPFFIMGLLLPVYGKELGATAFEIGLIFSAFSVMTILIRPLVGWALDRFGRRPFYVIGMLGYALTMVAFAYSDQVWGMLVARLLQGASSAFAWLSASAIIADITGPENRARYFGRLSQASSRGSILGAFVVFSMYSGGLSLNGQEIVLDGWKASFLVFAAGALVAFVIALRGMRETNPGSTRTRSSPIHWSRAWTLLMLVTLVTAAAWAMTSPILILFLQERLNAGIDSIAWAFLPSGIIWALLPAHMGRLADRFGRKPLMVLGLVVSAATMFILPSLTSMLGLAVLWSVLALCFAAGDPAEQALVADLTGGDQRGRAYGLYVMASDIGAALGPLGGGWLYDNLNPSAPFLVNGVILALCALLLLFFLHIPRTAQVEVKP
jgi:DHA1 family multidrug resistance protein-like MFS transporter